MAVDLPVHNRQPISTAGAAMRASATANSDQLNAIGRTRLVASSTLRQRVNRIGHEHVKCQHDADSVQCPQDRR